MKKLIKDSVFVLLMIFIALLISELGLLFFLVNTTKVEASTHKLECIPYEYQIPSSASPMAKEVIKNLFH